MRFSRLLVASVFVGSALVACGGDDGGGGGGTVDAPQQIDAPMIDAPTAMAEGLGKRCDQMTPCPSSAMICALLNGAGSPGFCTLSCGSGPVPAMGQDPTPPMGGDAICMGATPAPPGGGTPACALTGTAMNNMLPWACGILCGDVMGTQLGGCPGGLTCVSNLCE